VFELAIGRLSASPFRYLKSPLFSEKHYLSKKESVSWGITAFIFSFVL